MSGVPDYHELARQLAVLEERMNTHQADYKASLERMERKMAERDTRMLLSIAAIMALGITILGFILT